MNQTESHLSYVVITPARNEEQYIEKTIRSMIQQTVTPLKWVIVSDGSTDGTAELVTKYLPSHTWIELVQLPTHRDRSFAGKVFAFNAGLERVKGLDYQVIGNLDADLSFDPEYCGFLLAKFAEDRRLGVAGTIFREENYDSSTDSFEGQNHVAGGCQFFRRQCFEEIGGYIPNREGGIDWIAVTTARMMNWNTRSFREKAFFHYRSLGTSGRNALASSFSYGEKDYYLGGHPIWELFRFGYRLTKRPYIAGGLALYGGYLWALVRHKPRPISAELMRFHRREQIGKLRATLKGILRLNQFDQFELKPRESETRVQRNG